MTEKKLQIDLSPLWNNPRGIFILRFKDIAEAQKTLLAMRIKKCAPQYTIRKTNGPTVNKLHEALIEINPIIFAESNSERRRPWQNFNIFVTHQISGYMFKNLCQAIYLMTCRKKQLTKNQIINIAQLSCTDYQRTINFIEEWLRNHNLETTNEQRLTPITDIGINDIAEARAQAERHNNNHSLRITNRIGLAPVLSAIEDAENNPHQDYEPYPYYPEDTNNTI